MSNFATGADKWSNMPDNGLSEYASGAYIYILFSFFAAQIYVSLHMKNNHNFRMYHELQKLWYKISFILYYANELKRIET